MSTPHFDFIMANGPALARRRFRDYAECLTLSDIKSHNAIGGGKYWQRGKGAWHGTSESEKVHTGPNGVFLVQKHSKCFDRATMPRWQVLRVYYTVKPGERSGDVRPVNVNIEYGTARPAHAAAAAMAGTWTPEQLVKMGVTE